MNISDAKKYIKDTVKMYLKKDEVGDYEVPVSKQRPIFLLGAPGIGKTAIMEQIANELDIALVSYSMTHHTRQSALGLPFIQRKKYGGVDYSVSEYTMSEIISTIYDTILRSGIKEGILFLDEINCVSETLAPAMLQLLQFKTFGKHKIPEGWIVVTAGNPKEYNKSVKDFDVATLDRLKVMNVEPDFNAWKRYATENKLAGVIINFLEANPDYFYHIETTPKGRTYVTARGWEDLSLIIKMYEDEKQDITEELVSQYIRNEQIVNAFVAYYQLYQKYKSEYNIEDILSGFYSDEILKKAKEAGIDERLALVGLLLDHIMAEIKEAVFHADYMREIRKCLTKVKESANVVDGIRSELANGYSLYAKLMAANAVDGYKKKLFKRTEFFLNDTIREFSSAGIDASFEAFKQKYDGELAVMRASIEGINERIKAMLDFAWKAFGDGHEIVIMLSEFTVNRFSVEFISMFGIEAYEKYSEKLMVSDRADKINKEIKDLTK